MVGRIEMLLQLSNSYVSLTSFSKKNYAFQHISTQEIEEEKRAQAILMTELVDLTGILKNATIQMSSTVTEQNLVSCLINIQLA